jgi:hypothetical protein
VLSFSVPSYAADAVYNVRYVNGSATFYLPATALTTMSVYCPAIDGTALSISYNVTSAGSTSPLAPNVTLLCAGLPSNTSVITYSSFLNVVTLSWPASQGNGSPILGYLIKRFPSLFSPLGNTSSTVLQFSDSISYNTSYNYTVFAYNQVGVSLSSFSLSINISQTANSSTSSITPPSSLRAGYSSYFQVNLLDSGGNKVLNPSVMLLEVQDVCAIVNGYECMRVNSSDPNYVPSLMQNISFYPMFDNANGTMSAAVTPELIGPYSFSVIQLQNYGVLANFWDNIWFLAPLDSSAVYAQLSVSWTDGTLITQFSSEYVSAKFFTFLLVPASGNYSFYVTADDNFRFFVNGVLLFDSWPLPCCVEYAFYTLLNSGYVYIKVEFRQLDNTAGLSVAWSSGSFPKQLVPSQSLFWPVRVNGSPFVQYASVGLSFPPNCYFQSNRSGFSGDLAMFLFFSADVDQNIINNMNDVFAVAFEGTSSYYFVSQYAGSGMSYAYVVLGAAGSYNVTVSLYGQNVKGSPFNFVVMGGYPNIEKTNAIEMGTVVAGTGNDMTVNLLDAFRDVASGAQVYMQITYLNSDGFSSSLGLPGADQSAFGFNKVGNYGNGGISFTVFVAGTYQVTLLLDNTVFANYTMISTPASIYPPNSVAVYSSYSVVAGETFSFQLQTRDIYYNNLNISQVDSYNFTATGPVQVQGLLEVANGVAAASFSSNTAGLYSLSISINGLPVGALANVTVLPGPIDLTVSYFTVPSTQTAGTKTTVSIYTTDTFGNLLPGGLTLSYSISGKTNLTATLSDLQNGIYSLIFTPLLVDTYTVTITLNNTDLGIPQNLQVTNSDVRGLPSVFTPFASQTVGKGTLSIISKDVGGNTVSNPVNSQFMGSQFYYAVIQGPQNLTLSTTFTDLTAYKLSLSPVTASGSYFLLLALMEENGLNGFYFQDNFFNGLYKNLTYHNFPGASSSYYTIKDPVININFAFLSYPDFCSAYWTGMLLPPYTGAYTFTVQSDSRARLTINSTVILDSITGSTNTGSTLLTGGLFYAVLLEYQNGGNNGFIRLLWASSKISQTIVPASALFSEVFSASSPYSLVVNPDSTVANMCQLSQYPGDTDGLNRAYLNIVKNFMVTAKDKYGNQAITATDQFSATLVLSTTKINIVCSNVSPGKYVGKFNATGSPGTYTLTVSLSISGVLSTVTSTVISILAGPTDATKTMFQHL